MADDNNSRYRTSDPFGRGPAQAAPANDPLAELARLIGQSDPFSEFGRDQRQPAAHDSGARYSEPAPQAYAPEPEPRYADPSGQRYAGDFPPRFADNPAPQSLNDWPGSPPSSPQQPQQHDDWPSPTPVPPPPPAFLANLAADPFGRPSQQPHMPQAGGPYDQQPYADPHGRSGAGGYQQPDQHPGFEQPPFTAAQAQQAYSQPIYPHEPEAGSMPPPHDDEFYDDAPRGGRRKGMLTVAAVLALAVVGTAGAFGYRSLFSGPSSSSPPPVIRASNEPSKVAPPATPNADPSAGKISYDRFNDAGKDEQVVKREEKPVDVPRVSAAPPRTVFPGAPVPSPARGNSGTTAGNPPSAIGEPRRVRTVPIRPDAGDTAANASESATPLPPPRQANAAPRSADVEPDPTPAPASRASSRNTRVAARSAPVQSAPAPAANAPLSLTPDANNNPSLPPPSAPQREASRAPAPAPRSTASTASSGGGGYLVQVSSQKSEADAQSSFRGIQSKYASVLSGQPHTVRRADLGAKGVYYRAMVGPYGSREEAIKVCSSLKQAGGDCVVQH